ncbi:non-symbiotic hemoglobin-like [Gigantopelta aegis]|uniref:non-symbiotic hemoglobin-like n=1 Tax=Gigantopelta aegis TaxID=1735272 RepID=UPI001B88B1C1|nr:non-symbiotic hemoglobin-like [Gigantopelta aegis]
MMGCFSSKKMKTISPKKEKRLRASERKYLPVDNADDLYVQKLRGLPNSRPEFTEMQKELVLESWKIVQQDISRVGVVLFMKLFEMHPDVQDVFSPFKGKSVENLKSNSHLKSHALRVMGSVEKCLARIHEPLKLEEMLHELGVRHVQYNAKVDYIDLVGPQFISAIQPSMGDSWNIELELAWSDFFKLISHIIKEAMIL